MRITSDDLSDRRGRERDGRGRESGERERRRESWFVLNEERRRKKEKMGLLLGF